ncbi:hypothetical protein NPIL_680481 [Nephila pilipes]|uniref:Uncharacterized protein n=1 Tax=Nephila pilipes TaxID=299642 RepID=A0A8X6NKY1_NEPPI|nr:hypothetical protein NPIL_680481 [Nephila pilipes]
MRDVFNCPWIALCLLRASVSRRGTTTYKHTYKNFSFMVSVGLLKRYVHYFGPPIWMAIICKAVLNSATYQQTHLPATESSAPNG